MNKFLPNKNNNLRRIALIWGLGCLFGLVISPITYSVYSFFVPTPGNIVALNSDTINRVAVACDLLHRNSDLMGRYSHYIMPHPPGKETILCMECSGSKVYQGSTTLGKPVDDSNVKLSQVHDDSREINSGVGRIIDSLSIQHKTLQMNLKRLRNKHRN